MNPKPSTPHKNINQKRKQSILTYTLTQRVYHIHIFVCINLVQLSLLIRFSLVFLFVRCERVLNFYLTLHSHLITHICNLFVLISNRNKYTTTTISLCFFGATPYAPPFHINSFHQCNSQLRSYTVVFVMQRIFL